MRTIFTCLLAALGLASACGQQRFRDAEVPAFAELLDEPDVVLLDVRSAEEFAGGHIDGALNIDQSRADFVAAAQAALPAGKTIAVYCRSGRRSASAAERLSAAGFSCVNLKGGILAWTAAGRAVTTTSYELDVFKTPGGKTVKCHALVHASIRIEFGGQEIELDPVTQLGNRHIDYGALPKADVLLVTHEHRDHFDPQAIALLTDEGTRFITNPRCHELSGAGEVMRNGDMLRVADGFTVEAVPAYNTTEGHLQFHPKGRDNGYVLSFGGFRIYVAGDTEDIPEMAGVKDVDVAFLPVNQPYTMTPEQAAAAARTVKPKVLFPYHYSQTPIQKVADLLAGSGIDVRIRDYR